MKYISEVLLMEVECAYLQRYWGKKRFYEQDSVLNEISQMSTVAESFDISRPTYEIQGAPGNRLVVFPANR